MVASFEMSEISPGRWGETRLSYAASPALVFRRPVLSRRSLLEIAWDRAWPRTTFLWPSRGMHRDRFFPMEFPAHQTQAPAPGDLGDLETQVWDDAYDEGFEWVEAATRAIQARGGVVIFVRFPSCGERHAREEKSFPRVAFWDRFADRTSGRTVHFSDYPSLSGYECPDGSHLDVRDTEAFTRALAAVIEQIVTSSP